VSPVIALVRFALLPECRGCTRHKVTIRFSHSVVFYDFNNLKVKCATATFNNLLDFKLAGLSKRSATFASAKFEASV